MIRMIAYGFCVAAAAWLVLGSIQFRQSIRDDVKTVHERMHQFDPESPGAHGKFLNAYYEDVYNNLPHMILPAMLMLVGATALFVLNRRRKPNNTSDGICQPADGLPKPSK